MILRVLWIKLTNDLVIELGGDWPGPNGLPATVEGKDPKTGEKKQYKLPATVGAIFFVKSESEGESAPEDPDVQLGSGEGSFYEIWAEPANEQAADVLGGKIWSKGPCTRRLRIGEQHVVMSEEEWPLAAAYKLGLKRMQEIKDDYEDIDALPSPKPPENSQPKQEAAPQTS